MQNNRSNRHLKVLITRVKTSVDNKTGRKIEMNPFDSKQNRTNVLTENTKIYLEMYEILLIAQYFYLFKLR